MVIFCPRCKKKHSHKEFPLDTVQIYAICTKDHATESCPSLPGLKTVYKEVEEETELVYLINQCRQWQARPTGIPIDPSSSFQPPQCSAQQYPRTMWQNQPSFSNWSQQPFPMLPWPNQLNQNKNWPNSSYFPPFLATLNFTELELVVNLAETYKLTSRNNPPTSTHTASTLHITTKPPNQLKTTAPSPTQTYPQQHTSSIYENY